MRVCGVQEQGAPIEFCIQEADGGFGHEAEQPKQKFGEWGKEAQTLHHLLQVHRVRIRPPSNIGGTAGLWWLYYTPGLAPWEDPGLLASNLI